MKPSPLVPPPDPPVEIDAAAGVRCSLADVVAGQCAEVVHVAGNDDLAARLVASGLWPGAVLEWITCAPFGDPLLVRVHGFRLALRRSEAARVRVKVLGGAL